MLFQSRNFLASSACSIKYNLMDACWWFNVAIERYVCKLWMGIIISFAPWNLIKLQRSLWPNIFGTAWHAALKLERHFSRTRNFHFENTFLSSQTIHACFTIASQTQVSTCFVTHELVSVGPSSNGCTSITQWMHNNHKTKLLLLKCECMKCYIFVRSGLDIKFSAAITFI